MCLYPWLFDVSLCPRLNVCESLSLTVWYESLSLTDFMCLCPWLFDVSLCPWQSMWVFVFDCLMWVFVLDWFYVNLCPWQFDASLCPWPFDVNLCPWLILYESLSWTVWCESLSLTVWCESLSLTIWFESLSLSVWRQFLFLTVLCESSAFQLKFSFCLWYWLIDDWLVGYSLVRVLVLPVELLAILTEWWLVGWL